MALREEFPSLFSIATDMKLGLGMFGVVWGREEVRISLLEVFND